METRLSSSRWRRKIVLLAALVALSLGVLGWFIITPEAVEVDVAKITRGTFIQEIRAEGYFRSKDIRTITAFATGDVMERITVKVGDHVKKDQALTTLDWDRRRIVRAPMDGIITKVFRDFTGPVVRGDPLVEIMDPTQLEAVAELLTTDAVKVKPGQRVLLSNWGGSELLPAVVIRVSKAGFVKPSALGVEEERTEVVAGFPHVPPTALLDIGSHFHTELRIQILEIPAVLKLPIGALIRHGEGWALFQIIDDRAALTPVRIGPRNNDEVVLESGPAAGTRVILYPGTDIHDKVRIRIIRRSHE